MTKEDMIKYLNKIIVQECKHFAHYLYASLTIKGIERPVLGPIFEKEMASELNHIREFGDKIVSMGGIPEVSMSSSVKDCGNNPQEMLNKAIMMEREILHIYHETYILAEKYAEISNDMSVVLLLEENIEHTTKDVEELEKLRI